jgi:hypothetical protein
MSPAVTAIAGVYRTQILLFAPERQGGSVISNNCYEMENGESIVHKWGKKR